MLFYEPMKQLTPKLSRREREIMDILLERREATAQEVRERLPDPPSNSAARALLARLESKGAIRHIERNLRYVYIPVESRKQARKSALSRLVRVFYDGSLAAAVTGLMEQSDEGLSEKELDELEKAIKNARHKVSK